MQKARKNEINKKIGIKTKAKRTCFNKQEHISQTIYEYTIWMSKWMNEWKWEWEWVWVWMERRLQIYESLVNKIQFYFIYFLAISAISIPELKISQCIKNCCF